MGLGGLLARGQRRGPPAPALHAAIAAALIGDAGAVRRYAPAVVCAAEDRIEADPARLLRLDPVNLLPAGDGLLLRPAGPIEPAAAAALAAAIGEALEDDPRPVVAAPGRWYGVCGALGAADWTEPEAAYGRSAWDSLPRGPAAGPLRRLMNEIQMVLHDHPVNRARAAAGLPEINSVWAWGWGAEAPVPVPTWPGVCFADHPYALGLAGLAGGRRIAGSAPAPADGWPDRGLKVCDAPWRALQAGDEALARRELERFDRAWGRPLLAALRRRRLRHLRLIVGGIAFDLRPADAWAFWRRPTVERPAT